MICRPWRPFSHLIVVFGIAATLPQLHAQEHPGPAQILHVRIAGGTASGEQVGVSGGVALLRVTQGDAVEIHWASDKSMTLHLHGYGIEIDVPAAGTAVMSLAARAAGRFPVEVHGVESAAKTLLYLEVHPR